MVDGPSGIPRGEETTPPIAHATAAQALAWQQQQAASADQLLEKWAAQGQTGRAGEAGTGGEWARPAPWGEPVPFRGKDSVSNWFCPRHFCSRKITV